MIEDIGQPWSPPKELLLPAPRPVKRKRVTTVRYVRVIGGSFFFIAGAALLGWVLFGLWREPGATLGAKWVGFEEAWVWLFLSLFMYPILFLLWLLSYFALRRDPWYLKWGKPARAVVTGVRSYIVRRKYTADRRYQFSLQYQDDAGNLVKSMVDLPGPAQRFSQNGDLTILYDPDKPSKCTPYPVPRCEVGGPEGS